MSALLLLALALTQAQQSGDAQVQLRFESLPEKTLLHVQGLADPNAPSLRRDGSEIVLQLPDVAPEGLHVPTEVPPVESLRLAKTANGLELRLRCDPAVTLEVQRGSGELTLVLSAGPRAADSAAAVRPGLNEMYRSLFPSGMLSENAASREEPAAEEEQAEDGDTSGGLQLGPISLRPSLMLSYVDGNNTIQDSAPVHDQYFQLEPRLGLNMLVQILRGRLRLSYQPSFRQNSRFAQIRRPSHEFDASLEQPVGAALTLRGSAHHVRSTLETNEVDAGREFFFGLGSFHRTRYDAGARFETGGRFDLDLSANLNQVRFKESAYFFDFDDRGLRAELGYDLTPSVRAGLGYVWAEVPGDTAPGRPEAVSRARGVRLGLKGESAALSGELSVQYQMRDHPEAALDGRRFRGVVAAARLQRELRPGTALALDLSRFTTLSAFEQNGFYVANLAELVATLPLPLRLSLRGGLGFQRNEYKVDAAGLGEPREDTLRAWTVGLGRAFTRWAYARVDYRAERRESNLDAFSNRTHTFIAQVGVGWLGGTAESR